MIVFLLKFFALQESLLDLHTKVTETNCGESSEQIGAEVVRNIPDTLVKHGNGSKMFLKPVDVCKVSSQLSLLRTCLLEADC